MRLLVCFMFLLGFHKFCRAVLTCCCCGGVSMLAAPARCQGSVRSASAAALCSPAAVVLGCICLQCPHSVKALSDWPLLLCCADLLLLCWGVCLQCLHAAKGLADWLLLLC